ncbi:MAG: DUF924 domain-containing protein [Pararhodobacter sp.]|nr:DUF924 domain-containing protein [Pararhodobacter sp.]
MPTKLAEEIVAFWSDIGPEGWYASDAALDEKIRARYGEVWKEAQAGGLRQWFGNPEGALGYLILTDQFPRNMFREDARAFATDELARTAAQVCVDRKLDLHLPEPIRQFFYMPFMHAENLFDQDRCVCLIIARMPETGAHNLLHARAHREVIRRHGRFPWRNEVLGRQSSEGEQAFLAEGGYGAMVRELA